MFRFANEIDREKLYKLWNSCFGDGEEYVYPFLDVFLKEDNVYIFEEAGEIQSAVYSLDCEIDGKKSAYFYAVATDENYRRQGLAKKEIEFLIDYKSQKGYEIFLLTASSEKNRNYYYELGFRDAFFCEKKKIIAKETGTKVKEEYDENELFELRKNVFKNNAVSFNKEHFNFALSFSDKVFTQKEGEKTVSYALYDDGKIIEAVSEKDTESFISQILLNEGKKEAEIYLPNCNFTLTSYCNISRGMVYCSNKEKLEEELKNVFLSLNLE